ncbi:RsmE family RNA methyltransferase [Lentisphaera profundi]|uniref:Ribosomal RNA small subunit methyltransferase E n=1 Tax=Lentisphaera profundi TaxID=1658616 RepID=A0ABY7W2F3_9BACT|nr:RsmE family RNA methyltransferase [Lentisphaera profundi]WDE99297.1 RsmE family RNA methyltransferase [Lentisphaera profundi]
MRKFFCEEISAVGDLVKIDKTESRHILQTLRMQEGDELLMMNGEGLIAHAEIAQVEGRNTLYCKINKLDLAQKPGLKISLFVAPPSNGTLALILKQAVELGVDSIYLMSCQYSVSKSKKEKNVHAELISAAKQSGNPYLPKVVSGLSFREALALAPQHNFYGAVPSDDYTSPESNISEAGVWIGPEGGFSEIELQEIQNLGACPLAIGPYILRVETAVNSVCSVLMSKYGSA